MNYFKKLEYFPQCAEQCSDNSRVASPIV